MSERASELLTDSKRILPTSLASSSLERSRIRRRLSSKLDSINFLLLAEITKCVRKYLLLLLLPLAVASASDDDDDQKNPKTKNLFKLSSSPTKIK